MSPDHLFVPYYGFVDLLHLEGEWYIKNSWTNESVVISWKINVTHLTNKNIKENLIKNKIYSLKFLIV